MIRINATLAGHDAGHDEEIDALNSIRYEFCPVLLVLPAPYDNSLNSWQFLAELFNQLAGFVRFRRYLCLSPRFFSRL